ncbi:MAG: cyclic beta 1-2 glucan synthetase, partial [Ferruginibacter sp.]
SLRFLSTTDWQGFVEDTSVVEKILEEDPVGIYAKMDFNTRDQYRHAVERIAKKSKASEKDVALLVIETAKRNAATNKDVRMSHVGYYLIGNAVKDIERAVQMRTSFIERCGRFVQLFPFFVYGGSIVIISTLLCWWLVAKAYHEGLYNWWLAGFAFLFAITISQFAITFVNWIITILSRPALLPQMDFSKGVPQEYRTMVVVPTLITTGSNILDLVESLEVRFLANRDVNISFALLTDFKDADQEILPDEPLLLQFAINKIEALNKKYDRKSNDTFFLFHRPRRWNAREKKWIGYERKRGKLGALNSLILGGGGEEFSIILGDENVYRSVKYIITLDTDTQLPRESASKMAGKMAHPLNQPIYSERKHRLINGYTILQPRVSNSLPVSGSSVYARIHGNEPGTDPYTRAVSDVYQDIFKEGSFIGKGIYDVEVFERTLKNKFPENRILSHDLLEGAYARAGLMTDVQLYEEYPESYLADIQRRHRWIRGDWQIADWLTPLVPGFDKKLHKNPVSTLSKWKIFDNLRRSMVPIAILLLLTGTWTILPNIFFWNTIVLVIVFLPAFVHFVWEVFHKPNDVLFVQHFLFASRSLKDNLAQSFIDLVCLPYEAFNNLHAILLTNWRVSVSRRNLLQWNPSGTTRLINTIGHNFRKMVMAPIVAVSCFIWLSLFYPAALFAAFPFLIAWLLSPVVVWYISKPAAGKKDVIAPEQSIYLRQLARKIWSFFETFVVKEDNWLPPDNYQEAPVERIAHRTSPTNIGMSLLANVTATDFGYITNGELLDRTANTFETLHRLERYRGHFYNWYDTESLVPLSPKYISTVDSGNLVGHLLTLKQALIAVPEKKIFTVQLFEGMMDTLGILILKTKDQSALNKYKEDLAANYSTHSEDLYQLKKYLDELDLSLKEILTQLDLDPDSEDDWWAEKLVHQLKSIQQELLTYFPWVQLPKPPEKFLTLLPDFPRVPTISQLTKIEQSFLQRIVAGYNPENTDEENDWLNRFRECITESARRAKEMLLRLGQLITRCSDFSNIDYDFLYDRTQHLLSIGYNVDEHRRDNSFYDLLASEARLTTFTAIAQGKLPQQSWFALGRQLTSVGNTSVLLSWSGSMFEYLMPLLVMPSYENTLLDQTHKAVVQKQIEYGRKR